jgi:hypothetical protein
LGEVGTGDDNAASFALVFDFGNSGTGSDDELSSISDTFDFPFAFDFGDNGTVAIDESDTSDNLLFPFDFGSATVSASVPSPAFDFPFDFVLGEACAGP